MKRRIFLASMASLLAACAGWATKGRARRRKRSKRLTNNDIHGPHNLAG